jgi:Na+/melibiose symporter-like transporter
MIAVVILALVLFLVVERRASEPVLPLRLFENRAFVVSTVAGLIVGFALFGSVTYLPLFLQVVKGDTPTASGLRMIPMMGGMLVSSIFAGQIISRSGRYKAFPIIGTAIMVGGLFLLSRMHADTSLTTAALIMMTLGLGLGMVMQVLVLAAQNAVDHRDLGVATSGATLFRLIGGSVGTAALGAIFAARLHTILERTLPPGGVGVSGAAGANISPRMIASLPAATRAIYADGFTSALNSIFLVATIIGVIGFALVWFLPETPLRETVAVKAREVGDEMGEVFPLPQDLDCDGSRSDGGESASERVPVSAGAETPDRSTRQGPASHQA